MYKLTYGMVMVFEAPSFQEVFINLYDRLQEDLKQDNMSYQFLESTVWIEKDSSPMYFYDARDLACGLGILVNGKIPNEIRERFCKKTQGKEINIKPIVIRCPECGGFDIKKIEGLNHVAECRECGEQFHSSQI
jgi:hypothetical protein